LRRAFAFARYCHYPSGFGRFCSCLPVVSAVFLPQYCCGVHLGIVSLLMLSPLSRMTLFVLGLFQCCSLSLFVVFVLCALIVLTFDSFNAFFVQCATFCEFSPFRFYILCPLSPSALSSFSPLTDAVRLFNFFFFASLSSAFPCVPFFFCPGLFLRSHQSFRHPPFLLCRAISR